MKKKPPLPTSSSSTSIKKPVKKVWGSVTLPIFVFDVMTNDVVAHLLHQNNPKFKKHDWATIKLANNDQENNNIKKGSENEAEQRTSKDPLKEFDKPLRFQCINLQTIYLKSFVSAVFKSLQVILKGEKLVCVKLSFF